MARFDQIFDAVRGMRVALDRLQNAQAQKVAGVGAPIEQVLAHFAQNLKRADDAYKKASDSAAKAMQAQQAAQTRRQSVYNSVVGQIPPGQRNRANVKQALGSSPAYQAAKRRAQAAQGKVASARGRAAQKRQNLVAADQANSGANKRAASVVSQITGGLGKVAALAGGPVVAGLSLMMGAATAISQSFNQMKSRLNSVHQSLTGFNLAISQSQMNLKLGDMRRKFAFGRGIEAGATRFAASENRARNAWNESEIASHNAGSALGQIGNASVSAMGEALAPLFRVANAIFNALEKSGFIDGFANMLAAFNPLVIASKAISAGVDAVYRVVADIANKYLDADLPATIEEMIEAFGGNAPNNPLGPTEAGLGQWAAARPRKNW